MKFNTLQIRAYLQTPIISDKYLPLDGIVYNQFVRDMFGPKGITLPRQSLIPEYSQKDLPFQKRNMNEDEWYYACSFAMWPEGVQMETMNFAKRFPVERALEYAEFKGSKSRVDTKRGFYKNYFFKVYTINTPYVDWYCRANKEALEPLLSFCTHIGKKSSQGAGSVLKWEVLETDKDWYKEDEDRNLTRAIPARGGNVLYGIRPSYWNPRHQTMVKMPS